MSSEDNLGKYTYKAFVDWLLKRSPVTYFIGSALGVAGLVLSGGATVDLSNDSLKVVYSNEITVISVVVALVCLFLSYGALKMQMKERYSKLLGEQESKLLKEKHNLQSEHEKNLEVLKAELELEKKKSANTHANIGTASNHLLKRIVRLEGIFAGYIGSARVQPKLIDSVQIDIYIADTINEQCKYRYIYDGDEALKASWNQMLKYLDESQKAISSSFHGAPLDVVPLSQAALYMSEYIKQVSSSGHELAI